MIVSNTLGQKAISSQQLNICFAKCFKVKGKLESEGYDIWIDLEQMGGSTLEAMARAVENASVVLICYSRKYKESVNTRYNILPNCC